MRAVLLVTTRAGEGELRYGAGVALGDADTVVTNLHVVGTDDRVWLLPYDPERTTWSPLEGGVGRLVFAEERRLVEAEVVATDPVLDLVVLRPRAAVPGVVPVQAREEPAQVGEAVFALGHPQESAWSSTAGVVSALHAGVIQHDAPINRGNSGGPLLDSSGALLGVNTMKLLGGTEGVGFARPVGLVLGVVDAERQRPDRGLDRSTPLAAVRSCEAAQDVRVSALVDCVDWEYSLRLELGALELAARWLGLDAAQRARLSAEAEPLLRGPMLARKQHRIAQHMLGVDLGDIPPRPEPPNPWGSPEARAEHLRSGGVAARLEQESARVDALWAARAERLARLNGMVEDLVTASDTYREARRLGLRVDEVITPTADLAWVRLTGRNLDGSAWTYSECWVRREGAWRQPIACGADERALLPTSWPPPALDAEELTPRTALSLARWVAGLLGDS